MTVRFPFPRPILPVAIFALFLVTLVGCGDKDATDGDGAQKGDSAAPAAAGDENFNGVSYTYDMTITLDQSVEAEGMEMEGTMRGDGTMTLTAGEKTEKGQRWRAVTSVAMSGEMMGTAIDTVTEEQTMVYLVSPGGELVDMQLGGADSNLSRELTRMLQNTSSRQSAMQMFMPEEWSAKKVGETWEDESLDTIDAENVMFGEGMEGNLFLITRTRTRYTYEGTVDTLGMQAVRLRYELIELDLSGQFSAQGLETNLSSKGKGTGVFYYAADDRVQLAGTSDLTTNSTITMPTMNQTMPMKQHVITTMARRTAGK